MRRDRFVHGRYPLRVQYRGKFDRFDNFNIAGTTADVAAKRLQDFRVAWIRVFSQEAGGSHDEARRAIATSETSFS